MSVLTKIKKHKNFREMIRIACPGLLYRVTQDIRYRNPTTMPGAVCRAKPQQLQLPMKRGTVFMLLEVGKGRAAHGSGILRHLENMKTNYAGKVREYTILHEGNSFIIGFYETDWGRLLKRYKSTLKNHR